MLLVSISLLETYVCKLFLMRDLGLGYASTLCHNESVCRISMHTIISHTNAPLLFFLFPFLRCKNDVTFLYVPFLQSAKCERENDKYNKQGL
jgi:hypothetical protein